MRKIFSKKLQEFLKRVIELSFKFIITLILPIIKRLYVLGSLIFYMCNGVQLACNCIAHAVQYVLYPERRYTTKTLKKMVIRILLIRYITICGNKISI